MVTTLVSVRAIPLGRVRCLALVFAASLLPAVPAAAGVGVWTGGTGPGPENVGLVAFVPTLPSPTLFVANAAYGMPRSTTGMGWTARYAGLPLGYPAGLVSIPGHPSTLLYATAESGVFRSSNGGTTWAPAGDLAGPWLRCIAVEPAEKSRLFVGREDGLKRSTDGGASWHAVGTGPDTLPIDAVAIDPVETGRMYAAVDVGPSYVYRSTDGGDTWKATGAGFRPAYELAIDPSNPKVLYAATGGGVHKSTDSGDTWTWTGPGSGPISMQSVFVDPVTPGTILSGTYEGLYRSVDGGGVWKPIAALDQVSVKAIVADPSASGRYVAATSAGIQRTTDAGLTWSPLASKLNADVHELAVDPGAFPVHYAATSAGFFRSTDDGRTWTEPSDDLSCAPLWGLATLSNAGTVLASNRLGLFGSTDSGVTFVPTGGLPDAPIVGLAWDRPSGKVFVQLAGRGLYWSTDGGASFDGPATGTTVGVWPLAVAPSSTDVVYGVQYSEWGPLLKSTDGGASWSPLGSALPDGDRVASLAVDPEDPDLVYAGGGAGFYYSAAGGAEWKASSTGLPATYVRAILVDTVDRSRLFVATGEGIHQSSDFGESWIPMNGGFGPPGMAVTCLARSVVNPRKLLAGTMAGGAYEMLGPGRNQIVNPDFNAVARDRSWSPMTIPSIVEWADTGASGTSGSLGLGNDLPLGAIDTGADAMCTPVSEDEIYIVGATAKVVPGTRTGSVRAQVRWFSDGACKTFADSDTTSSVSRPDWSAFWKYGIVPPAGARSARLRLLLRKNEAGGLLVAQVDDVVLKQSVHGDVDGNDVVNVTDVLYLINHLFAGGPAPLGYADANGDGAVNVSDVLYLINHLFAGGPAPA